MENKCKYIIMKGKAGKITMPNEDKLKRYLNTMGKFYEQVCLVDHWGQEYKVIKINKDNPMDTLNYL